MDPTTRFFSKLRKLVGTLESETAKLQHTFENRNNDNDSEGTAKAMQAYHELNCEVGTLKGQIQGQIAQQKAQANEVSNFIKTCRVMEQRLAQDIRTLKGHWEKYGYQAPRDTQRTTKAKGQESETEDEIADENETKSARGERGSQEEAGGNHFTSPPTAGPIPFIDLLQTPQLSDFGLSEMQLKRTLAGCSEVPPMPEMSIPHPSLNTPAPPPMPLTPKCALRMDDDELQTPQMSDFGISEHTMCLNDFTMDLLRKNVEKPQRPSQDMPGTPANTLMDNLQRQVQNLESPEPPVFCTPGFKIKKTNLPRSPLAQRNGDPESPERLKNLPTTPEIPAFKTPYVHRLVSNKKPIIIQADEETETCELSTHCTGAIGSKRPWEYDVPDVSIMGVGDNQMPDMPNLESDLGNSLQTGSAKRPKKTLKHKKVTKEPIVHNLELDGPTQEFSLGTPRIRMDYQEPGTPEMPDLSSVTQDICKLVSQAQLKKTAMEVAHPNRAVNLSVVSESEFQGLPSYMRQMTLSNLNLAIQNINKFTAESRGEQTEFLMEELRAICLVGTKTPVYVLCLTELNRLKHMLGVGNNSMYKLCTHM
ncbi:spindle and kinetochore-associated protein 3 [Etheostoma cragini]|uniref:spindle and kinetochore-associated protein 3 n=1 Tax=Etheostoma cragini TaxID=417921 RepID=UPI00155F1191|nr:spindle and kinetochore-associated protein 3 [Etheostoma cragini]